MHNFELISKHFRVQPALDELATHPDLWKLFTARQETPGTAHHDTECIVMRGPKTITQESVFNDIEAEWLPYAAGLPALMLAISSACLALGHVTKLGRVMVVNLKPNGHIDPHIDEGAYAAYYERFHLVLQSERGNWFHCGREAIHMQPGEFWKFNHHEQHEVHNLSTDNRIHIIIDAQRGQEK